MHTRRNIEIEPAEARCTVVEVTADPDSPRRTIRRLRRADGLWTMRARGQISDAQWLAAELFRRDLSLAEGAREDRGEDAGVRATWRGYEPAQVQLDALERVRQAQAACGLSRLTMLAYMVTPAEHRAEPRTLRRYADLQHVTHVVAAELLRQVLDCLADHYSARWSLRDAVAAPK